MKETFHILNCFTINNLLKGKLRNYNTILFDSNNTCNLHCVYCHNSRTKDQVELETFSRFLDKRVKSVRNFQIGCGMEPTMDKRMLDFIQLVSKKAKPTEMFRIQTNGLLLHKFDATELREAGINKITISMDTLDPNVHKELRGNSDIQKIIDNIKKFQKDWFYLAPIDLIVTVSSKNIHLLDDLMKWAAANRIQGVELRKMFHYPDSDVIKNHDTMKDLLISNEEFLKVSKSLRSVYWHSFSFCINDEEKLNSYKEKTEYKPQLVDNS